MRWPWSRAPRHQGDAGLRLQAPATEVPAAVDPAARPDHGPDVAASTVADLGHRFRQAWVHGDQATAVPELLPVRLARACVYVLPVTGAGLSLLTEDFRVPLGANDDVAEAAERLQFTQGEGPCLDAAHGGRTLISMGEELLQRWPAFGEQLAAQTPFETIISVPLPLSPDVRCALDLYLTAADPVEGVSLAAITIVSDQIVQALTMSQAISGPQDFRSDEAEPAWLHGPSALHRTNVWIAMGMLITRLQLPAADALARLRGYAYTHEMDLDQLAASLIEGAVDLERIEA